jgi:hypothetical protein
VRAPARAVEKDGHHVRAEALAHALAERRDRFRRGRRDLPGDRVVERRHCSVRNSAAPPSVSVSGVPGCRREQLAVDEERRIEPDRQPMRIAARIAVVRGGDPTRTPAQMPGNARIQCRGFARRSRNATGRLAAPIRANSEDELLQSRDVDDLAVEADRRLIVDGDGHRHRRDDRPLAPRHRR